MPTPSPYGRIPLGSGPSPEALLSALWPFAPEFLWLPSWGYQRESILALAPQAILTCESGFQWEQLQAFYTQHCKSCPPCEDLRGPLAGGIFGTVSYEAALGLERLRHIRPRTLGYSAVRFGHYPVVLCYQASTKHWELTGQIHAYPEYTEQLAKIWRKVCDTQAPTKDIAPAPQAIVDVLTQESEYAAWVKDARDRIQAGDIYQANLAHPLRITGTEPLPQLFARIHAANPSPWASLYRSPAFSLLSNSPELLVSCRSGQVQAKPIAGTRPRGETLESDQRHRENLLRSPKERAEHLMLVDLVRNDLGRICAPGTVHVPLLMDREPYQNVTHIVSTIEGKLDPTCTPLDTLVASFPGGTITGTPKLRSMEIIDSLEAHPRGYYTGSLGYLSAQGDLEFNILIRTLQVQERAHDWTAHLHVGAGIVADSSPAREYQETLHKAAAWSKILLGE